MQRRKFLRTAGLGAGGVVSVSTLAAPAIAQSMPDLKWRLASSFPKSLDTLYGAGEVFAKYINEMTDHKFQIRVFASGEIVPGLQVLDAVQNGTVELGHSAGTYYVGKDPALAIDTALPFGTNARQQEAWIRWGGGRRTAERSLQGLQHLQPAVRQYRRADGGLVPQGDQGASMTSRA